MKIYVAGAWRYKDELVDVMNTLQVNGHTITHDWTGFELEYNDHHDRAKKCGRADIKGVCDADVVLAVMNHDDYQYKGTRHELGAALALRYMQPAARKPLVYIVCNADLRTCDKEDIPQCMRCCFEHLADEYFLTIEDALKALGCAYNCGKDM